MAKNNRGGTEVVFLSISSIERVCRWGGKDLRARDRACVCVRTCRRASIWLKRCERGAKNTP